MELDETASFCSKCGAPQAGAATPSRLVPRTFGNSIQICFKNYARSVGRAPRAEFWYFQLFQMICGIAAYIVAAVITSENAIYPTFNVLSWIVDLALFLPAIAVAMRRLHDIDRSGGWLLIMFIPIVGWIVLFVWACTRGTRGPNRFGEDQLPAEV